ncbi:energy transducer TonB [uncultured Algimonas sp.]|uniref:energy transducer TonB n=1 Tax=uncultured Algimonas sp. TaxID=1547920 RepID=UPI002621E870|nr:energy transducer TonB [uncultured Algimonas sp.]
MYQSIEDEPLGENAVSDAGPALWLAVSAVGLLVLIAVWWSLSGSVAPHGQAETVDPMPEARQSYLRALGETDPALRRARLTDFLTQHPDHPRRNAVRAQLDVLDGAADRDWQATLTTVYDPRYSVVRRRAAVEAYQQKWGQYLGARDEEIAALRADIEETAILEGLPERTRERDSAQYAGVPDDRLAGGPSRFGDGFSPSVIFRPSRNDARDGMRGGSPVSGDRTAPQVRRNATPRYPRRAMRRGEEAVVTLSLTIDADGRVSRADVIDVQADRYTNDFVREAERAAMRTRFHPRTVNGVPVETRGIRKRYRFELDN